MSSMDELQWTEIANINRRLFAVEQQNIAQDKWLAFLQNLISAEGESWRRTAEELQGEIGSLWTELTKTTTGLEAVYQNLASMDKILLDGLVEVTEETAQIGNYLAKNLGYVPTAPFNTDAAAEPGFKLPEFKLPDFSKMFGDLTGSLGSLMILGIGGILVITLIQSAGRR